MDEVFNIRVAILLNGMANFTTHWFLRVCLLVVLDAFPHQFYKLAALDI